MTISEADEQLAYDSYYPHFWDMHGEINWGKLEQA